MHRVMLCLAYIACFTFVSQIQAQDDVASQMEAFLEAYYNNPDVLSTVSLQPASDFETKSSLCGTTRPTEFKIESLSEIYPLIMRATTDQGVLLVTVRQFDTLDGNFVQQLVCEDSPEGQALEMLTVGSISVCAQDYLRYFWVDDHWLNRAGDRALVRIHTGFSGHAIYVYMMRKDEAWVLDKQICGHFPEGQALNWITDYMSRLSQYLQDQVYVMPFFALGTHDLPTFADVTSVQGGFETGQATVLIQLEAENKAREEQSDPICMVKLRDNFGWVIYEMRCTSQ